MDDIIIFAWVILAVAGLAFIIVYIAAIVKFFQMAKDLKEIKEHLITQNKENKEQ